MIFRKGMISFNIVHVCALSISLTILSHQAQGMMDGMIFKSVKTTYTPNEWMGEWQDVSVCENKFCGMIPITSDIDSSTGITVTLRVSYCGNPLPDMTEGICDSLINPVYGKQVVATGLPVGVFPEKCPIEAGDEYLVNQFTMSKEMLPPCPSSPGSIEGTLTINGPSNEVLNILEFDAEIDSGMSIGGAASFGRR